MRYSVLRKSNLPLSLQSQLHRFPIPMTLSIEPKEEKFSSLNCYPVVKFIPDNPSKDPTKVTKTYKAKLNNQSHENHPLYIQENGGSSIQWMMVFENLLDKSDHEKNYNFFLQKLPWQYKGNTKQGKSLMKQGERIQQSMQSTC